MSLKVGIQLFSVCDEMGKDPIGTLKALKKMGYDGVELFGTFGMSPEYFKGVLDTIGLEPIAAHIYFEGMEDANYDRVVGMYKRMGVKYIVLPYQHAEKLPGGEDWLKGLEELTSVAKKMKADGLQLLYHNHSHELDRVNGDYVYDTLMNTVPADLLKTEVDVGWVTYKNVDAGAFVRKYKGRAPLVHLKDYATCNYEKGTIETCPFGSGAVNAKAVLEASEYVGAEWVIIEQDCPYKKQSTVRSAKISRNNLKKLGC